MESFFSRYRNALVLIAVLLAQVIGLAVQVRRPGQSASDKGSVRLIRSWVANVVSPPERVLHSIGLGIRGTWANYLDLIHVRQENKDLKAQLDRLRLEQASLAEDARQGQRLQALLGFQEKYIYKTVAAQVIGASGTDQSQVLLIDKGSKDGIKPDMPVITPDGIVGKTRDVFGHTSQVLQISDTTSGAGVILEKTRIRGVLRGDAWGQPEIVHLSPDERIQAGEPVLTSGGDAIFPRGLPVGTVERVVSDPDGTLVNVLIKPAANLLKLEEVLVIVSAGDVIPAQMQQDVSDAQQKASEVLAERLPSRIDPNAPQSQQDQADEDDSADEGAARPVQPPQALHPDRYTPSGTPPAADLVPGQKITSPVNGGAAMAGSAGSTAAPRPRTPGTTGAAGAGATGTAQPGAENPAPRRQSGTETSPSGEMNRPQRQQNPPDSNAPPPAQQASPQASPPQGGR